MLLFWKGKTRVLVAALLELSMRTVSFTHQRWMAAGLCGLAERTRSGAPAKVPKEEAERLLQWERDEPLMLTVLPARHEAAGCTPMHVITLKALLKGDQVGMEVHPT